MRARVRGFYREYHGHKITDLETVAKELPRGRATMYLVGDSTMDNKYWLRGDRPACNGYQDFLDPPRSVPDVAYWINHELELRGFGGSYCCVNAAIEESTLGLRDGGKLLPQDVFVQGTLQEQDIVICSMGGNDIALRPTLMTILSMIALLASPKWLIKLGLAPGLGHFVGLFRDATAAYLKAVCRLRKPRCIVPCMLYFLDERAGGSWADGTLQRLGYDKDPSKLQLIMREVYQRGVEHVVVDGVPCVVPVPMYEALDGSDSADYVQRVEPSSQGGEKLAKLILDRLDAVLRGSSSSGPSGGAAAAQHSGAHARADDSRAGEAAVPPVTSQQPTAAMPGPVHLHSARA